MKFEILISTMHKDTRQVSEMLANMNVSCDAVVIVQGDFEGTDELELENGKAKIFYTKERGLSKSRNLAIAHCTSKYVFIMDDDVVIKSEALDRLVFNAEKDNLDVFTCSFLYENGDNSKAQFNDEFVHDYFTLAKVSSIEIGFKVESVKKNNILFHESFGLGTDLPSGEEYIFLTDCLKMDLKIKFFPIIIGVHPNITSGMDFYTASSKILAKREMLRHIFKWKSPFFILAFWLKKNSAVNKGRALG